MQDFKLPAGPWTHELVAKVICGFKRGEVWRGRCPNFHCLCAECKDKPLATQAEGGCLLSYKQFLSHGQEPGQPMAKVQVWEDTRLVPWQQWLAGERQRVIEQGAQDSVIGSLYLWWRDCSTSPFRLGWIVQSSYDPAKKTATLRMGEKYKGCGQLVGKRGGPAEKDTRKHKDVKIDFALHQICWTDVVGSEAQSSSRQAASGQHRTRQGSTWKDIAPAGGRLGPQPEGSVQLASERHCHCAQTGSMAAALRNPGSQPEATAGGLSRMQLQAAASRHTESQAEAAATGQPEAQPEAGAGSAQAEPRASLPPVGASSKRAAPEAAGEACHPKRPRTEKDKASSSRPRQTSGPQTGAPLPGQASTQSPAEQGATAGGHGLMQAEPAACLPGNEWPDGVGQRPAEQGGSVGHSSPAQALAAASLPGREQPRLRRKPPGTSEPDPHTGVQHTVTEHFRTPPDTCAPSASCSAASDSCHQLDIFLTAHSQDSCPRPGAAPGAVGCEEATSSRQTPAQTAGDCTAAERPGSEVGPGCRASGGAGGGGPGAHQQPNGPECVSDSGVAKMRPAGRQQPHGAELPAAAEVFIDLTTASSSSSASAAGPDADAARQCVAASPSTELPQLGSPASRVTSCAAQMDHVAAPAARVPLADSRALANAVGDVAAHPDAQMPQLVRQVTGTLADAALEDSLAGSCLLQPPGQAAEATDYPLGRPQLASSVKAVSADIPEPAVVAEPAAVAAHAASQLAPAAAAATSTAGRAGVAEAEAPGKHVQPATLRAVGKRLVKKVMPSGAAETLLPWSLPSAEDDSQEAAPTLAPTPALKRKAPEAAEVQQAPAEARLHVRRRLLDEDSADSDDGGADMGSIQDEDEENEEDTGADYRDGEGGSTGMFPSKQRSKRRGKGTGTPGKPGKDLKLADLQAHFGVDLKEAAARLGISPTTLRRACCRHGIRHWPGGRYGVHRRRVETELSHMRKATAAGKDEPTATGTSAEAARHLAHMDGAAAGMTAAAQAAAAEAAQHAAAASAEPAAAAVTGLGDTEGSAHGRRPLLKATARKTTRFQCARLGAEQPAAAISSGLAQQQGQHAAQRPADKARATRAARELADLQCQLEQTQKQAEAEEAARRRADADMKALTAVQAAVLVPHPSVEASPEEIRESLMGVALPLNVTEQDLIAEPEQLWEHALSKDAFELLPALKRLALDCTVGLERGSKGALAWDEAVVGALRAEYPETFGQTFKTSGVLESAVLRHVSLTSKKRKSHFDERAEVREVPAGHPARTLGERQGRSKEFGVYARKALRASECLGSYSGILRKSCEVDTRTPLYRQGVGGFILDKYKDMELTGRPLPAVHAIRAGKLLGNPSQQLVVDACLVGGPMRRANSPYNTTKKPNLLALEVINLTTGCPYLMFFTACHINADEELLWSYGNDAAFFSHMAAEQVRCGTMLVLRKQIEMLREETESSKKKSEQKDRLLVEKDRLLIEQQEQLRASEQQLQAALARLARQQHQEVAAAGREVVQRQEQQQAKAAAAAHSQHAQQEELPAEQQQHAGNVAEACTAAATEQPAIAPMWQADSSVHLESAADLSDCERMQAAGQSDGEEVHEAGAAPGSLVHGPAGFIARQAQAGAAAARSPSAEHPASGVSAAAGRPEGAEPGSADGEPVAAHRLQPVAVCGQVEHHNIADLLKDIVSQLPSGSPDAELNTCFC